MGGGEPEPGCCGPSPSAPSFHVGGFEASSRAGSGVPYPLSASGAAVPSLPLDQHVRHGGAPIMNILEKNPPYPWFVGVDKEGDLGNQLYRNSKDGCVMVLLGGYLRHVPNMDVFNRLFVKPKTWNPLPQTSIPVGPALPTFCHMVKTKEADEVYLVDEWNGIEMKRHIKGSVEMKAFHFNNKAIRIVSDWEVACMMNGLPISFTPCPWLVGDDMRGHKNIQLYRHPDGSMHLLLGSMMRSVPPDVFKRVFKDKDRCAWNEPLPDPSFVSFGPPLPATCRLLQGSGTEEVYLTDEWDGGVIKRHVMNMEELESHQLDAQKINVVDKKSLSKIPTGKSIDHTPRPWLLGPDPKGWNNNQLYKRDTDGCVMLLIGGYLRRVPSMDVFKKLFKDDAAFNHTERDDWCGIPVGPSLPQSCRLIKTEGREEVYFVDVWNGVEVKRHVQTSCEMNTHNFDSKKAVTSSSKDINALPTGKAINHLPLPWLSKIEWLGPNSNQLYRNSEDGAIMVLLGGYLRHVPSMDVFNALFKKGAKFNALGSDFNNMPIGPPIHITSRLIKAPDRDEVYLQEDWNGKAIRRHIVNPDVFNTFQFCWKKIQTISESDMTQIAELSPITFQ